MDITDLKNTFFKEFGEHPIIFRAPGRVNIIGEHTDYNDGLVLPFPVSQSIYLACSLRNDDEFHVFTVDLDQRAILKTGKNQSTNDWTRYFVSALRVLHEDNHKFKGLNIVTKGNIPFGAGISSSSALTCGFLYAIISLNNLPITKKDIVFIASRAENNTGLNGGKMDQFAICMGAKNKAIKLDCRDYSYELIENNMVGASWMLFNTNVEHNLAHTEYNLRRADCEEGLAIIQKSLPSIHSVRDLDMIILNNNKNRITSKQYDRLSHVILENERVTKMVKALKNNELFNAGQLLYDSHYSLSDLYEVSCKELDFIVEFLKDCDFCYGARMMGGGFGGCVIALIKKEGIEIDHLLSDYYNKFNLELTLIPVISSDGISRID